MPLTHTGYGGSTNLGGAVNAAINSLAGIGQTSHRGTDGTTAQDAVRRYAATGASEDDVVKFAKEIGAKHGRFW